MKARPLIALSVLFPDHTGDGFAPCLPSEATHVQLHMPGPLPNRILPLFGRPSWKWDRNCVAPTISPSILSRAPDGDMMIVCHSFVRNGVIEFLGDCTHELAGQSVELLDVD